MLTQEQIDSFHENGFLVGLSLDGPREYHDAYRKNKAGQGTFDRAMRAAIGMITALDLDEGLLELAARVELVHSPLADARDVPEGVDVCLVEGAVATSAQLELLRRVRARTRILVAERLNTVNCTPSSWRIAPYGRACENLRDGGRSNMGAGAKGRPTRKPTCGGHQACKSVAMLHP